MIDSTPNPVDVHVGDRIRARRRVLSISQEKLAEALGLTFQQVQKYERGANRVSASKLWAISQFLKVQIEFFFDGLGDDQETEAAGVNVADRMLGCSGGLQIARLFPALSPDRRRALLACADALSTGLPATTDGDEARQLEEAHG